MFDALQGSASYCQLLLVMCGNNILLLPFLAKQKKEREQSGNLRVAEGAVHGQRSCWAVLLLRDALEGDVVAKHLTRVDERQYLLRYAGFFAADSHDASGATDGDVGHVLH